MWDSPTIEHAKTEEPSRWFEVWLELDRQLRARKARRDRRNGHFKGAILTAVLLGFILLELFVLAPYTN